MPAHSPQISLSVTADADLLHIEISDNGCGIAPEDQEHIFEPFITHKVDGTGLGLAITRRIIQAHHGTITLRSARYAGTVFILSLIHIFVPYISHRKPHIMSVPGTFCDILNCMPFHLYLDHRQ